MTTAYSALRDVATALLKILLAISAQGSLRNPCWFVGMAYTLSKELSNLS